MPILIVQSVVGFLCSVKEFHSSWMPLSKRTRFLFLSLLPFAETDTDLVHHAYREQCFRRRTKFIPDASPCAPAKAIKKIAIRQQCGGGGGGVGSVVVVDS